MKTTYFLFYFLIAGSLIFCKAQTSKISNSDKQVASEMQSVLVDNILHVWYPKIIDTVNGGFYTNFTSSWEKMPRQEKMIVTQTRDLWTACKAAEKFPDDLRYRQAADHGFVYLRDSMWDKKEGGFLSYTGTKEDNGEWSCKNTYGNGFAIYALSAYYKLSQNKEAIEFAKKTFKWLESKAHDAMYGGYFNFLCQSDLTNKTTRKNKGTFDTGKLKDFNSSIHIMEALAELYQVWPDSLLRTRLSEMLCIVRDTFTTNKGFLHLYFTANWEPVSMQDSTEAAIRHTIEMDHVSFGHDIETAYLLLETSKALGLKKDTLTMKIAKKMVDHTLVNGFDKNFAGIFDGGYYFKGRDSITIMMDTKNWWSQAEGLNALLLFSKLYPDEKIYKSAFYQLWDFVKKNFVDYEHGDWYSNSIDKSVETKNMPKASAWKCNYHTTRALMNCIDMLDGKNLLN